MVDIKIIRADTASRACCVATAEGVAGEGDLTISKLSATLIIADHTGVPDTMRGMGVAGALVGRLVSDARAAGQRIVPLCPFVLAQAQRHKADWADVIQW
ncbi:GNAT family N-acetyltransferase [Roseicitreum antarcticum]|uniref:N-acetyltransferase domain-containing protein n=1 Tax=Roseicitreum antarcticum TaxID=564137 RepID=A0A1H2TJU2_9RHOB|nr:GNAT family N-acetyltransferase [Roseicitreum antarcticum]SDW43965.1 hypothetical protein SAMN04488238_10276 [Roseicitreum antarcticum]